MYFTGEPKSTPSSASNSKTETSIVDNHCLVDVKYGKFSHLWTIKHFQQFHCSVSEVLKSTAFSVSTHPEYKWYLELEIKNKKPDCGDYFGLYLHLDRENAADILVKAKFCLLDVERNEVSILRYSQIFENNTSKSCDSRWGFPTFISKALLLNPNPTPGKKLLLEDTLTVLCEAKFYVVNSTTTETVHWHGIQSTINDNNLSTSMERLLHSQDSIDVKFSLNGKNFGAHKLILSARSPVFAAMFKHNMLENQLNEVKISDMNPEVFEEFLRFLYSDKISDPRMARDLLVAAEKYNVDSLKLLCEEMMLRDLSAKNATDFLVLADLYGAERLKKQVIFYIKTHPANIMLTESWKNTIIAHPHLFDEVNGPFVSPDSQLSKSSSGTTTTTT